MALSGLTSPLIRAMIFRMTVTLRLRDCSKAGMWQAAGKSAPLEAESKESSKDEEEVPSIRHVGLHLVHVRNSERCTGSERGEVA